MFIKSKKNFAIALIAVLIVLAIGYVLAVNIKFAGKDCNWRPPKGYKDYCPAIAGYYYNGVGCADLGKCVDQKDWNSVEKGVLFQDEDECTQFSAKCKILK